MHVFGKANSQDKRDGNTVELYTQRVGVRAKWNNGKGPELAGDIIQSSTLHGGYAMVCARVGCLFPFTRGAYYEGGIKTIKNAPRHESKELATGVEWQFKKRFELTLEVDHARRTVG